MPDSSATHMQVRMQRVGYPDAMPVAVNKAVFAAVGPEAVLELGFVDVRQTLELLDAKEAGESGDLEKPEVHFHVLGRFFLTPPASVELLRAVRGIVNHFQRHGHLPADLESVKGIYLSREVRVGGEEPPNASSAE